MLDTESHFVHFFRKTNDVKPYQTLPLTGGILMDDLHLESDIIDQETGQRQPGFKFQFMSKGKKKGKELTVIPEQPEQCRAMVKAFQDGAKTEKAHDTVALKQSSINAGLEQKANPIGKRSGISRMSRAINNAP